MDPLTTEYPWYTPYQFAGNKPIRFIDLEGLEEGDPMPNNKHVALLSNEGYYPFIGGHVFPYIKIKGRSLENAFIRSFNLDHNYNTFNSSPKNIKPDAIQNSVKYEYHISRKGPKIDVEVFENGVFFEVKAIKGGKDKKVGLTAQIRGMINSLAGANEIDGGDDTAGEEYAAVLVLVTYSDVSISDLVLEHAEDMGFMCIRLRPIMMK